MVATATEFNVELNFGHLRIDGLDYDGSQGPEGLVLEADAELEWETDYLGFRPGFTVCASEPEPGSFAITPTLFDSDVLTHTYSLMNSFMMS